MRGVVEQAIHHVVEVVERLDHADRLRSLGVLELDRRAARLVVDVAVDRVVRARALHRRGRARDAALGGGAQAGDLVRTEHRRAREEAVVAPGLALGFGQAPAVAIDHPISLPTIPEPAVRLPARRRRVSGRAGFYASFTPRALRSADQLPRVLPPGSRVRRRTFVASGSVQHGQAFTTAEGWWARRDRVTECGLLGASTPAACSCSGWASRPRTSCCSRPPSTRACSRSPAATTATSRTRPTRPAARSSSRSRRSRAPQRRRARSGGRAITASTTSTPTGPRISTRPRTASTTRTWAGSSKGAGTERRSIGSPTSRATPSSSG